MNYCNYLSDARGRFAYAVQRCTSKSRFRYLINTNKVFGTHKLPNLRSMGLQCKMASVEQMDLGIGNVAVVASPPAGSAQSRACASEPAIWRILVPADRLFAAVFDSSAEETTSSTRSSQINSSSLRASAGISSKAFRFRAGSMKRLMPAR